MKDKTGWNKYRRKQHTPQSDNFLTLDIESLTNSGDGLGRVDQRVVFVPYTIPGDKVKVRITQQKKTWVKAEVVERLVASQDRIDPLCPYFEQCGGCDWQHVPYPIQLAAKETQLKETLARIGSLGDIPIKTIEPSDTPWHYRNRIQGTFKDGNFHFKRKRSEQEIAISQCVIAEEAINDWLAAGNHEHLTGRFELTITDNGVEALPLNQYHSTELGFRQVNSSVNQKLSQHLLNIVEQTQSNTVLDLYCGTGGWTTQMATQFPERQIIGVDASAENITAAKSAARSAKLVNLSYREARVEAVIPKLPTKDSVCIVDPPRAGLDAAVTEQLVAHPCHTLVYVSCHPATLARDLAQLTQSSYSVQAVTPMDMFPQTAHLECLVHLTARTQP